jgi:hypothetical protein
MNDDDSATAADLSQATTGIAPTEHVEARAWSKADGPVMCESGDPDEVSKFGHFDDEHHGWGVPVAGGIVALAALVLVGFAVTQQSRGRESVTVSRPPSTTTVTTMEPPPPITVTSVEPPPPVTVTESPPTVTVTPPPSGAYTAPSVMPQDWASRYDEEYLGRLHATPGFVVFDPTKLVWWGRHACLLIRTGVDGERLDDELAAESGENLAGTQAVVSAAELTYPGCGAGV